MHTLLSAQALTTHTKCQGPIAYSPAGDHPDEETASSQASLGIPQSEKNSRIHLQLTSRVHHRRMAPLESNQPRQWRRRCGPETCEEGCEAAVRPRLSWQDGGLWISPSTRGTPPLTEAAAATRTSLRLQDLPVPKFHLLVNSGAQQLYRNLHRGPGGLNHLFFPLPLPFSPTHIPLVPPASGCSVVCHSPKVKFPPSMFHPPCFMLLKYFYFALSWYFLYWTRQHSE